VIEVTKTYAQELPALRFVGIKYGDGDRVGGGFGKQWCEWFSSGRFAGIDKACVKADFEDADACIGLMRWKKDEPFQYWVGKFFAENSAVPEGFGFVDFKPSKIGVGWLYGPESEIYAKEHLASDACEKAGMKIIPDGDGAYWFFERYAESRFCPKDDKGNIVLDIGHFIENR